MRKNHRGYNASTSRAMAQRTARREEARKLFYDQSVSKEEIMEVLGVTRCTLNLYLREQSSIRKAAHT